MPGVENAVLALLLGSAVNSGGAKQPMKFQEQSRSSATSNSPHQGKNQYDDQDQTE